MGAVIGAAIYLAVGTTSFGKDNSSIEASATPTQQPVSIPQETSKATVQEERIITYTYDTVDAYDSYLLAKIAMAEAGNQDTEGKALVMLVVLNRAWGDNEFPDTVEDVIYDDGQFSPVLEGKFEQTIPNKDCWDALEMVMQGWDESKGALYFESKSSSTWHEDNLKFLFKHQDHYFYTEKE
jgi:N-acetylmuramoyl-L-alanine amidase